MRGLKKECWHMLKQFTYFNFISDQPGPPPARIRERGELVRCREKRRSLTSHANMTSQAP